MSSTRSTEPSLAVGARPRNDLVLRALAGEATPRTPVWMMRQAGRFDPEYHRLRAEAGLELEDLFRHPEYAARITLLPVRLGVDAAILYQDILTLLTPMGAHFVFRPGPTLARPVRTAYDAERLAAYDPRAALPFVFESIQRALDLLAGELPLLGFAGAPFTLLAFLVAGGSPGDGGEVRSFLRSHEAAAHALLERLADVTSAYLSAKIDAGVHAVQLFESCADLVSPSEYTTWCAPYQRRALEPLAGRAPRILFARDAQDIGLLRPAGADAYSLATGVDLRAARAAFGPRVGLQGNVCNRLLHSGTPAEIAGAVRACVEAGEGRGHVLNLGHGILKGTPFDNVVAFLDAAHEGPERA
ncbi:MAG: uroporphyrinogen decarboxylase family protein [Planctomycetota bacterium]